MLKYFNENEFKCCCGNVFEQMDAELLIKLDMARDKAGVPFKLTSTYRCPSKNKKVGGKSNSAHLSGNAVDIACSNSVERFHILDALLASGFTRIGIAKNFIHADIDDSKPQQVIWNY